MDSNFIATSTEEVREAQETLEEYLKATKCPNYGVGVIFSKEGVRFIVYINSSLDPTFRVPVQLDGIPIICSQLGEELPLSKSNTKALAKFYSAHCTNTEEHFMEGPCRCGDMGEWDMEKREFDCGYCDD